jgi:hypothetical protein
VVWYGCMGDGAWETVPGTEGHTPIGVDQTLASMGGRGLDIGDFTFVVWESASSVINGDMESALGWGWFVFVWPTGSRL